MAPDPTGELMHLSKYHGLGNDFLVTFADELPRDGADLARRLCHRTRGVGADGLIYCTDLVEPEPGEASATFSLFNSDGSRAEVSGNGMRCFAHAVACRLGRSRLALAVATPAGPRRVDVELAAARVTAQATVDMGLLRPLPIETARRTRVGGIIETAVGEGARWTTGDMGNPHLVVEVPDPAAVDLSTLGPIVESEFNADLGGMNVHVIAPSPEDGIDLRVWERGVGLTEACGSGACAAAAAAVSWGIAASPVTVHMPGGSATVSLSDSSLTLAGPSVFVAEIEAV